MSRLNFKLEARATGSRARAATFRTLHNEVKTPLFMPVGTQATVKAQLFETLEEAGSQILLANTYHLMLRPGPEVFQKIGGIHGFTQWPKSFLTDSGGFQIFSLPHSRQINEDGAVFQSYVDKRYLLLSPETSIAMQKAIGSDIMMVLDQCVPSTCDRKLAIEAMHLTHRWAQRSLNARGDSPQSMFGIVQGACFEDLRKQSADVITSMPFDGFAIGGLAVGETKAEREDFCELTAALLPEDRPRYLMGVGTPIDLLEAVHRGVDMFDCIIPTAYAQQGVGFTSRGRVELRRQVYRFSEDPLDPACPCPTCRKYSRAYLHHLHATQEVLGWSLMGQHNIYFYHRLMKEMRDAILNDTFAELYRRKREELVRHDEDNPKTPQKPRQKKRGIPMTLGAYEVHVSPSGFSSIRQNTSGEIMHSVNDPRTEARRLYIEQSRLEEKLLKSEEPELILWDVGLGAATNAMEAVFCHERLAEEGRTVRPLHIVSFENDLDSLRLVLKHPTRFPQARHGAPHTLLQNGSWESRVSPLRWTLIQGDFYLKLEETAAPDLIFFDPFSYKTDSQLWSLDCFRKVHQHCGGRAVELFTYSGSTGVRSTLLASGFFVARGVGTGPKAETTIALTREALKGGCPYPLLSDEWLERWERSGARVAELEPLIRGHRQFVRES